MIRRFILTIALVFTIIGIGIPDTVFAARLFSSGCEFQGDSPGNMTSGLEWIRSGSSNSTTQVSSFKRSGLSSCRAVTTAAGSGYGYFSHDYSVVDYTKPVYVRFYMNVQTMPTELVDILMLDSIGSTVGSLILNPDGRLSWEQWVEDSVPDFNTAGPVIMANTWHRVEVKFNGDDRTTVRVDGVNVLDVNDDGTNDTMQMHLGIVCDHFCGSDYVAVGDIYFDDIAINDSEGSYQNSWPGPGAIVHLQPDGVGDNSGCALGSVNSVDEITPENPGSPGAATICSLDTTGVESNINSGDIVDVNVESPTSANIDPRDQVSLVSVGIRERPNTTGDVSFRLRLKSASGNAPTTSPLVYHYGATFSTNGNLSTNPNNYPLTAYKDPTTLCSWMQTGTSSVNSMQIGVSSIDASPLMLVDTLWALVEYSPRFAEPCASQYGGNIPDPISTAVSLSSETVQKKFGNFWAASLATDKICMGNGQNCTTVWNRTPKCRLEHHRVTARPNATNFPSWNLPDFALPPLGLPHNIALLPCDQMLTPASIAAGWVSTGYDKSLRVFSNDGHTPSVCQFTRLVCDPNVELLAPTVTGPSVYPITNFTTSSNQCSDLIDNDNDGDYDTYDPDCISWSDNSESGSIGGGQGSGGCEGCNQF